MFKNNSDVAFGDVNLSQEPIRGNHNPGMGGWPTIRYFNKKTGYEGGSYEKKTSKAMCDELGDNAYMRAYVEEYGGTSLCSAATGAGCTAKENKYIAQWKEKSSLDVDKQITRLEKMASKKMKAQLKKWINQRLAILKQLKKSAEAAGKDEL
mmetsp:Transcript_37504/g.69115  ORF Transcript_37504/g.69115 Transcript_37504/m.69115 type:complete len:152 (-) Transcript_37504:272-727(-)